MIHFNSRGLSGFIFGFDLGFGCSDAKAYVCPPLITISPSTMN
jgi:hypothetical protein